MKASNRKFSAVIAAALLMASACATVPSNIAVRGDLSTIGQLVGSWEGVYNSQANGRSGTISFQLRAGTDTAHGEVIMIPRSDLEQRNLPPDDVMTRQRVPAALLTIRFVAAADDEVTGVLDPYPDPECGCTLMTRFFGRLRGDEIKGKFTSTGSGIFHGTTEGTWSVRRVTTPSRLR